MPEESPQSHGDMIGTELPVVSSSSLVHNTSDLPSHHLHPSVLSRAASLPVLFQMDSDNNLQAGVSTGVSPFCFLSEQREKTLQVNGNFLEKKISLTFAPPGATCTHTCSHPWVLL